MWVKCDNLQCKAEYQMSKKGYYKALALIIHERIIEVKRKGISFPCPSMAMGKGKKWAERELFASAVSEGFTKAVTSSLRLAWPLLPEATVVR